MSHIEQAIAAPLQHLEFVVQPLDKAAVVGIEIAGLFEHGAALTVWEPLPAFANVALHFRRGGNDLSVNVDLE